jgi:hypothetical protein
MSTTISTEFQQNLPEKSRRRRGLPLTRTAFWEAVEEDIFGPRQGGATILVDAEDARKGVGKTSCAVGLARAFASAFGYRLQLEDMVLSGNEYMNRLRDQPGKQQPSVVVWDEAVGAGAGDGRRAMANQNVIMGRAWQTLRAKRIVQFVTLPDLSDLDTRLKKLADYRVYCLRKPIGYFQGYEIGTSFDPEDTGLQTRGLSQSDTQKSDRVRFPDVTQEQNVHYEYLAAKKAKLNDSSSFDADEELGEHDEEGEQVLSEDEARRQTKVNIAQNMRDSGATVREAADAVDMSPTWVYDNTDKPEDDTDE